MVYRDARLGSELSLADIAEHSGVSRFHLLRAFGVATGQSVMRYACAQAARARLRAGWPAVHPTF